MLKDRWGIASELSKEIFLCQARVEDRKADKPFKASRTRFRSEDERII